MADVAEVLSSVLHQKVPGERQNHLLILIEKRRAFANHRLMLLLWGRYIHVHTYNTYYVTVRLFSFRPHLFLHLFVPYPYPS